MAWAWAWWFWIVWIALLFFIILIPFWGYPRWGAPRPYFMRTRRRPVSREEQREEEWYAENYQDGWGCWADVLWIAFIALAIWFVLGWIF